MSVPAIEIFSSIAQAVIDDPFTLDSADFGVLDTDVLEGKYADVLLDVPIRSMSISRGKSRQLDRFRAGTASVSFNNFDRRLDPLNTDSEFYGDIVPRQRIKIFADGISIFDGVITDWDIDYDQLNWDTASASAADWFTVLANYAFDSAVTPVLEAPADRLNWVVEQFEYQGETDFLGGSTSLGAYQVDAGVQALDYMFRVADSDRSQLFVDAGGVLRLVGVFDRVPTSVVTFADDGSGIGYQSLTNQYGDDLLFNRVTASSPAGSVVVEDSGSIADFDVLSLTLDNLLNSQTSTLTTVAGQIIALYGRPEVRFTGLSVELAGLSESDRDVLLRVDLTDQVTVRKSFAVGLPLMVEQNLMVTGIRHTVRPGSHLMEFSFEPSVYKEAFKLDDAVYGILNGTYVLG